MTAGRSWARSSAAESCSSCCTAVGPITTACCRLPPVLLAGIALRCPIFEDMEHRDVPDPTLHLWDQYVTDTVAIMHALDATSTHLVGAGLGGTIALRTCLQHPQIARSAVIISAEAIEDDGDKAADAELMARFADRARSRGLQAAWELFVPHLQPLIANLVTEAIPRADAQSAAAAAAIGQDRAFATIEELRRINAPTLIIAGNDPRHPTQLARTLADTLPHGVLAEATMSDLLVDADDIAQAFGPAIEQFLATTSDPDT